MTSAPSVPGKTVLVTGAASGMSRVTVLAFAVRGVNVVAADVAGEQTVALIAQAGRPARFIATDVSNGPRCRRRSKLSEAWTARCQRCSDRDRDGTAR